MWSFAGHLEYLECWGDVVVLQQYMIAEAVFQSVKASYYVEGVETSIWRSPSLGRLPRAYKFIGLPDPRDALSSETLALAFPFISLIPS
jgi:hypothetical protein